MSHLSPPVGPADHVAGPVNARVTLVEYGDFQCPYCGEMYNVIKDVQAAMGDRMRFVFRHFPLTNLHQHALHAAQFAEAAAKAGNFWGAHDVLFQNQTSLADDDLMGYARLLDLPATDAIVAFEGEYDTVIQRDFDSGVQSGVKGTPTLFINGQLFQGAHDADAIVGALHAAMRRN